MNIRKAFPPKADQPWAGTLLKRNAFTLIEILVSLAIVAVLSTVVVVTLNPAELIKQARDSNRISDLNTINTALGTYAADVVGGTVGASSTVYVSLPSNNSDCSDLGLPALSGGWVYKCVTAANLTKIDGSGWIPANFQRISFGNPLEKLPIDQKNTTSTGLYYTFVTTGSWWELTSILESAKYGPRMVLDGGASPNAFEQGTNLTLTPTEALDRGVPPSANTPTLTLISPTSTYAGDPQFTLTVNGTNFTTSSVVRWGGSDKATAFVSDTQLTALILNSDISASGTVAVTVFDAVRGTSGSSNFAIGERTQFIAGAWTTDSSGGASQSPGASMTEVDGTYYILAGGTTFQKYNPSTKAWTTLRGIPAGMDSSAAIVKYDSDTLYATNGWSRNFYKYVIHTDTWSSMASPPTAFAAGASLAYPGSGNFIYALRGGTSDFWKYSVPGNYWETTGYGASQYSGASMAESLGKYYVLVGGTTFQKYDPVTTTWTTLATIPAGMDSSAAIVKYDSDTLYATNGWSRNFYKYVIHTDTWSSMASPPTAFAAGASLAYPGLGNFIYALRGGTTEFWKYDIVGDAWTVASSTPSTVDWGGALTALNSTTLYAYRGANTTDFWKYNISTGSWSVASSTPAAVYNGGSLTSDGTNLYGFRGYATPSFWKYSPSGGWTTLPDAPSVVGQIYGGARGGLAYSSGSNKIYGISGLGTSIMEYNVGSNVWVGLPYVPSTVDWGGALTALNSGTLYAFRGANTTDFWKYNISTGYWSVASSTPAAVYNGGSLTSDGTNIYGFRGYSTPSFWKYSPSGGWTVLADAPANIGDIYGGARGGLSYSTSLNLIFGIAGRGTAIYKNSP